MLILNSRYGTSSELESSKNSNGKNTEPRKGGDNENSTRQNYVRRAKYRLG
jgi:hypothetical protein